MKKIVTSVVALMFLGAVSFAQDAAPKKEKKATPAKKETKASDKKASDAPAAEKKATPAKKSADKKTTPAKAEKKG